jgi:membrane-associated phospholipid phosphatase
MHDFFSNQNNFLINYDIEILKFINIKLHNSFFDFIVKLAANDVFLVALIFSGIFLFFKIRRITKLDKLNICVSLWALIIINIINTFVLKPYFKRQRPVVFIKDIYFLVKMNKLGYAFPSTHTAMATAFVVILWKDYKELRPYLALFLFFIAFFCIYSGGHYPLDVVAGIIFGWIFGIIFNKIKQFLKKYYG